MLGDAAHPMYPIGSNGASQAILDAEELGKVFDQDLTVEEALKAYEEIRRIPITNIVKSNR
ncbi:hypothetical protein AFL42_02515 [Oceanobacillus caeni]|uniref:FAD-binding domain-containing protein n=1 Tax=Oceanobacillus caeni TaxID=405946 RepID=A0ABR5MN06_9BACI|nr:hypothetical protein AFL42_02515 [Oceanobacillus caeni]